MEKKFTKGNWGFGENYTSNNGTHVVYSTNNSYPTQNTYIATTLSAFNSEADAKLMAAAPDMLAALEYLIESINPIDACRGKFESLGNDRAYVGGMTLPTDESILRCIEAIKKATK